MAESSVYDEISLISKGLYRIVSDIVGPECIVKLRRLKWCYRDKLDNCDSTRKETKITSGSRAEGFKFKTSDFDYMFIDRNAIALTNTLPMIPNSCNKNPALLLMETESTTPGFAFVKCLSCDYDNELVYNSLVLREDDFFVSSKQIRETFMTTSTSSLHGPCQTSTIMLSDHDVAYTLVCPVWPTKARSFILRGIKTDWPSYDTLTDVCTGGCLLVPINSKQQQYSDMMDLEWRISFSLAEKKLICSMNHCQFLCYGLLKIFFNECLKKVLPNEDDLCSYFMKTAIFWEISEDSREWVPWNFLSKFWKVFQRLMKWVCTGYCPNFFIPENNMFRGKICGDKQQTVLCLLRELYSEGYWCLLRCASLNENLSHLITQPDIANMLAYDKNIYIPKSRIEIEQLFVYICFDSDIDIDKTEAIIKTLINTLSLHTESEEDSVIKRLRVNHILQCYAERLFLSSRFSSISTNNNRTLYRNSQTAQNMLYRTRTFFCSNYFILIKHLYMTGNYYRTIDMIHYINHKLQSQPFMYVWNLDADIIMAELQQGMSYDALIKSFIVSWVQMDHQKSLEELMLEVSAEIQTTGSPLLFIPPLVFLNFLLFLSYTNLGEYNRRRDVLDELHSILHHDDGNHIHMIHKAISWEILGICQQLYGDRRGSLESYIYALNDKYNDFKQATIARIFNVHVCRNK